MKENHPTRRDVLREPGCVALARDRCRCSDCSSPLCFMSAVEMARLIRAKKLSAREALAAHLTQIERVNPKVNAIVTLVPELAAAAAAKADEMQARGETLGRLHGLPVAHKDLFDTRGIRTTFGSPLYKDNVPSEDDIVVERMRRAGAITIGKTNTPEFGAGSQTFNTIFGATRNPYDLTRTCGGSSGGAAVALACGLVPVASGSDTGGSLRNPAAFCNVVGFRPSLGRVPNPKSSFALVDAEHLGLPGTFCRRPCLALSTIAGPEPRAPLSINEPGERFARPLDRSFKGTRVAWFKDLGGVPFDPRVRAVVDGHRKTFESLGCVVEQAEPDFAPAEIAFRVLRAWNTANSYGERFRAHPEAFKDTLAWEIEEACGSPAPTWLALKQRTGSSGAAFSPSSKSTSTSSCRQRSCHRSRSTRHIHGDRRRQVRQLHRLDEVLLVYLGHGKPSGLSAGRLHAGGLPSASNRRPCEGDVGVLQLAHAFEQATGFGKRHPTIA